MSLVFGICFDQGILLASDAFAFDNDFRTPRKILCFDRFLVLPSQKMAAAAVGSHWVFSGFSDWLTSSACPKKPDYPVMAAKWRDLNQRWRCERQAQLASVEEKTLRPISDSTLIFACADTTGSLFAIDAKGGITESSSFIFTGSGGSLVQDHLFSAKTPADPPDCLSGAIKLVEACFNAASSDLYVSGWPSMVVVQKDQIIDLSTKCEAAWSECRKQYYQALEHSILSRHQ